MKIILIILFIPSLIYSQSINFEAFKANKIKGVASFQFSNAFYYDYVLNSSNMKDSTYLDIFQNNSPDGVLTKKYSKLFEANKDSTVNSISVYSKLTLVFNQDDISLIKYSTNLSGVNQKMEILATEKIDGNWRISTKFSQIIEAAKVVLKLKKNAFSQFEKEEDDKKYLDINRFKKMCKDPDGTLNIIQLAKIIENNKTTFLKYID
jgi:hypothetical protein